MRKPEKLELSEEQLGSLESWMRNNKTAAVVRTRCQMIVLKAQGRSAVDIGSITGACSNSVHSWVNRYKEEGIDGLLTKAGRGRKKLLKVEVDAPVATQSIQQHRQSLKAAKAAYEQSADSNPVVSEGTFRRFLKVLATPTSASESGWVKCRTKTTTTTK